MVRGWLTPNPSTDKSWGVALGATSRALVREAGRTAPATPGGLVCECGDAPPHVQFGSSRKAG
ncbi:protein of unknown function (plasmid) [Caballeronia sp. S22]